MVVFGHNVGPLVKKTARELRDDNILGLAAQTAYFFFFSLFPLMLFAAPLLSLSGNKQQVFDTLFGRLASALPGEAATLLADVLRDVVFSESAPGLISLGALLALWAGSNIFSSLMDALNRAYDVDENRAWWKRKLVSLVAVVFAGIVLLIATAILLAGEDIAASIGRLLGLDQESRAMIAVVQVPLAFVMLVALAWVLFYYLPNVRQDPRHTLVGAIVTTVLWMLVTLAFRAYVSNFGAYNKTYGTIGGVIVLLTWMYLSMIAMLVGGELNSELHQGTGAIKPRSGVTLGGRILAGTSRPSTAQVERMAASGRED